MKERIILFCAAFSMAVVYGEDTVKADVKRPYDTSTWIGSNYTPAYAANQIK